MFRQFATIGAAFGAIRALSNFEQAIANVGAISGASAQELEALREVAQELGSTTRFTATAAAEGLTFLARAGFSVSESIATVDDTLRLAQVGSLDLASAADIATNVLAGFNLRVDEAGRFVDVLALTASSANTDVRQLGDAFKFVAPVAAGVGVTLEEAAAAIGSLSNAGLQASTAGTGLRRVLSELEAPAAATLRILGDLGVSADDVKISTVGLNQALAVLSGAGLSASQALEIFGQRGGPAAIVLANAARETENLTEKLGDAEGFAEKTAAALDDNLQGSLLRVLSAAEALVLALGEAGATDALRAAADALSGTLNFLADNADLVQAALIGVGAALLAKFVAPMLTKAIPATRAFALSLVLARGNVLLLAADFVKLNAALAVSPLLVIGAAAAAATISFRIQADIIKDIEKSLANIEEDAKFAGIGSEIRRVTQELNKLNQAGSQQGFLSDSQQQRVDSLTDKLSELRAEARRVSEEGKLIAAAQDSQTASVDNSIASLDRRIAALQETRRETEILTKLENEVQAILRAGQVPSSGERETIEQKLRLIQALEDQQKVLDDIRGPQEEAERRQAALNALLERGAISTGEYRAELAALKSSLEEFSGVDPFEDLTRSLRDTIEIERTRASLGDIAADLVAQELDLRRQGVELTREQKDELATLAVEQAKITDQVRRESEARREAMRDANQLERLTEQLDLQAQVNEREAQLNAILAARPDLIGPISAELQNLQLRALESSTALEDGFARAILRLKAEAEDLAAVGDSIVNAFADRATDALVEFAETGKLNFKEFASSLLSDITRIIARLLIVQALSAAFGGAAGSVAAQSTGVALAGAREDGGTVQPGRSYVVGEKGPEIFRPEQTGTIIPNPGQQQQQQPPAVNVINVSDPSEIPAAIASGNADTQILNVLARNKDRVKQVIQ